MTDTFQNSFAFMKDIAPRFSERLNVISDLFYEVLTDDYDYHILKEHSFESIPYRSHESIVKLEYFFGDMYVGKYPLAALDASDDEIRIMWQLFLYELYIREMRFMIALDEIDDEDEFPIVTNTIMMQSRSITTVDAIRKARKEGFDSVQDYLDSIVKERDQLASTNPHLQKIAEGIRTY